MGKKIDLLKEYPKSNRNVNDRGSKKTKKDREIARKFDKNFFDGDRRHGYGGYSYHPKFWSGVVETFKNYWNLSPESTVLDVGCGKGFMLYDLKKITKSNYLKGIDISEYAINNSLEEVKHSLSIADAKKIPFPDNSFDVVISINTIHNLEKSDCAKALNEISRVSKKHSFITVDAYRNEEEKKRMFNWNLTAKTIMSEDEWEIFFKENNYDGDYYWFIP
jgi:SAM-dependent methyltransferase